MYNGIIAYAGVVLLILAWARIKYYLEAVEICLPEKVNTVLKFDREVKMSYNFIRAL